MKSTKKKTENTPKGRTCIPLETWLEAVALRGWSAFVHRYTFVPDSVSDEAQRVHAEALCDEWEAKGFKLSTAATVGAALARVRPGLAVIVLAQGRPVRVVGMRKQIFGGCG